MSDSLATFRNLTPSGTSPLGPTPMVTDTRRLGVRCSRVRITANRRAIDAFSAFGSMALPSMSKSTWVDAEPVDDRLVGLGRELAWSVHDRASSFPPAPPNEMITLRAGALRVADRLRFALVLGHRPIRRPRSACIYGRPRTRRSHWSVPRRVRRRDCRGSDRTAPCTAQPGSVPESGVAPAGHPTSGGSSPDVRWR